METGPWLNSGQRSPDSLCTRAPHPWPTVTPCHPASGPGLGLAFQTLVQSGCLGPRRVGQGEEAAAVLGLSVTGQPGAECPPHLCAQAQAAWVPKTVCVTLDIRPHSSLGLLKRDGGRCCVSDTEMRSRLYRAWPWWGVPEIFFFLIIVFIYF